MKVTNIVRPKAGNAPDVRNGECVVPTAARGTDTTSCNVPGCYSGGKVVTELVVGVGGP